MFVDIKHPKSPLKIANILTAYDKGVVIKGVRQPPKKLTPEVCFDILKSTNYPRCIRDILQLIAKLPDEEQAQFKDVVLACFDNREQPEPVLQLGQEIAEKSGYGIEFAKLKKIKEGAKLNLYRAENLPANLDFSLCSKVNLSGCNFSAVKKLVFKNREQMKESFAKLPDGWKGKLVFADSLDHQWGKLVVKMFGKGAR